MVASQGSDGLKLYVDGDLVGQNGQTQAQGYDGYWRIGGDNTWGSSSGTFEGRMDEVAVYPTVLAPTTVATHFSLGTTGRETNQAPNAAFTQTAHFLTASFDATGSTDSLGRSRATPGTSATASRRPARSSRTRSRRPAATR